MRIFFQKLHTLPEEVRKLLAAICMFAAGVTFLAIWISSLSSSLVALSPNPAGSGSGESPVPSVSVGMAPALDFPSRASDVPPAPENPADGSVSGGVALSPAAGMADLARGISDTLRAAAGSVRIPSVRWRISLAPGSGVIGSLSGGLGAIGASILDGYATAARYAHDAAVFVRGALSVRVK